ncbi:MAG: carboxypeptidase regulatory-like domain-containing protein [Anaerolineales bacterium]|nr:carboxypeptidase regulatory-like domain-containing protein [Anaerolineales bacterium]
MNRKLLMAYMTIIQIVLIVLMAAPALATDHDANSGIVSGTVYYDSNGNSVAELDELNVPHATVYVQRQGGAAPIVVTADAAGDFVLTDLAYGAYLVWAEDAHHNMSLVIDVGEVGGAVTADVPIVYDLSMTLSL